MGRRHSCTFSPLAALAVLLLLICSFLHCGEAARPLPVHHGNGVKDAADGPVLQEGAAAAGNGDELSISEVVTGEEAEEEVDEEATTTACEERDDECVQRRMLRDAHLDYIYTQHRGKP